MHAFNFNFHLHHVWVNCQWWSKGYTCIYMKKPTTNKTEVTSTCQWPAKLYYFPASALNSITTVGSAILLWLACTVHSSSLNFKFITAPTWNKIMRKFWTALTLNLKTMQPEFSFMQEWLFWLQCAIKYSSSYWFNTGKKFRVKLQCAACELPKNCHAVNFCIH